MQVTSQITQHGVNEDKVVLYKWLSKVSAIVNKFQQAFPKVLVSEQSFKTSALLFEVWQITSGKKPWADWGAVMITETVGLSDILAVVVNGNFLDISA